MGSPTTPHHVNYDFAYVSTFVYGRSLLTTAKDNSPCAYDYGNLSSSQAKDNPPSISALAKMTFSTL